MKGIKLFTGTAILLLLGNLAQADTLRMKNGTVIKGKVIRFTNREFTIMMEGTAGRSSSRAIVSVEDIDSIDFDAPTATVTPAPSTSPANQGSQANRPTMPPPTGVSPGVRPAATSPRPDAGTEDDEDDAANTTPGRGAVPSIRAVTINVPARDDWTSTGIVVQRGQRIRISANGQVDLGNGRRSAPEGTSIEDKEKLLVNWPTGALIAVIGDDNDDFIFVGRSHEFVAQRNGRLFLSVNEGNLKDNTGAYSARVEVDLTGVK